MNISELQKYVSEFSKAKGFEGNTIETRTLYLMTEVGELAKEVLKVSFHPDAENIEEVKENLGYEMFDVVWNIIDLANKLDINLEEAFKGKMEINDTRVWK